MVLAIAVLTKLSNIYTIMAEILRMYKIEHRMQICLRNAITAGSTDHVGNRPLRELNLNLVGNEGGLEDVKCLDFSSHCGDRRLFYFNLAAILE